LGIVIAEIVTLWQCGLAVGKVSSVSPKNDQVTNKGNCSFTLLPPRFRMIQNIRLQEVSKVEGKYQSCEEIWSFISRTRVPMTPWLLPTQRIIIQTIII